MSQNKFLTITVIGGQTIYPPPHLGDPMFFYGLMLVSQNRAEVSCLEREYFFEIHPPLEFHFSQSVVTLRKNRDLNLNHIRDQLLPQSNGVIVNLVSTEIRVPRHAAEIDFLGDVLALCHEMNQLTFLAVESTLHSAEIGQELLSSTLRSRLKVSQKTPIVGYNLWVPITIQKIFRKLLTEIEGSG